METITLKNFQAHKHTIIELSKVLTAIIGKSSHAKSSIIRGIQWVRTNRPSGSKFIRRGEKVCEVSIDQVTHLKSNSENSYLVGKDKYTALRTAVPDQVQEILNLSDDNIQDQHDSPFLIGSQTSPGEVTKKLSSLIDAEQSQKVIQQVKADKNFITDNLRVVRVNAKSAQEKLAALAIYVEMDEGLGLLEQKQTKYNTLVAEHTELQKAVEYAQECSKKLQDMPYDTLLKKGKSLYSQLTELEEQQQIARRLSLLISKANKYSVDFSGFEKLVREKAEYIKYRKDVARLRNAIDNASNLESHISSLELQKKETKKKVDKLLEGKCPLCGK